MIEEVAYGADGQQQTHLVYGLRAAAGERLPALRARQRRHPTPVNPLGAKAVGEAGTIGSNPLHSRSCGGRPDRFRRAAPRDEYLELAPCERPPPSGRSQPIFPCGKAFGRLFGRKNVCTYTRRAEIIPPESDGPLEGARAALRKQPARGGLRPRASGVSQTWLYITSL